jgi:hypothetical protein
VIDDIGNTAFSRLQAVLITVLAAASLGLVAFWIGNLGELTHDASANAIALKRGI